jgi:hypothetical protein
MKHLATLLDKSEAEVAHLVGRLEETSGFPAEDARLLAESAQQVRSKIASLGLDPDDTTAQELHHALLVKYQGDAAHLDRALGLSSSSTSAQRSERVIGLLQHVAKPADGWFIKSSVIKKYLAAHPPKNVMKSLSYRSVSSLLKRQNLAEIVLGCAHLESPTWLRGYQQMIKRLNSSDYELRPTQLISFGAKWQQKGLAMVSIDKLYGAVGLYLQGEPSVLSATLLAAQELQKLNPRQQFSLDNVHPALNWWLDSTHLISLHASGQTVSLNVADVAHNHSHGLDFAARKKQAAQFALTDKLKSAYHKYLQDLPQALELEAEQLANADKVLDQPIMEMAEI